MAVNIPGVIAMVFFSLLVLGTGIWASFKSKRKQRESGAPGMEMTLLANRSMNMVVGVFTMTGKIQEVILQENLEKEDEVLVSLAGLKQIKDILKGSLRFNQSQLEAEENEEISIADDHYTSTAVAETALSANNHQGDHQQQGSSRPTRDSDMDGSVSTDEKEEEEEQAMTPPEQQVASSLGSEGKNWDDYILVCQDGDLPAAEGAGGGRAAAERTPPIRRGRGLVRMEPEGAAGTFSDPLMAGITSGSSSPDEGSTHSKDSDFTIVNPNDL